MKAIDEVGGLGDEAPEDPQEKVCSMVLEWAGWVGVLAGGGFLLMWG